MAHDPFDRPRSGPATDRQRGGPTLDRLCGALASELRRDVLYYLKEGPDDTANVEALAEHLAERDEPDAPATTDRRKQAIATELSHVHLPKLDAADVVEYAPDSETVEYAEQETVEALLDATPGESRFTVDESQFTT